MKTYELGFSAEMQYEHCTRAQVCGKPSCAKRAWRVGRSARPRLLPLSR